jgi:hypothetical protein
MGHIQKFKPNRTLGTIEIAFAVEELFYPA